MQPAAFPQCKHRIFNVYKDKLLHRLQENLFKNRKSSLANYKSNEKKIALKDNMKSSFKKTATESF